MKKLVKSHNRVICGVCGGLAEYLGVDATIVRLIWAIFAITGAGLIAYIVAALIIPEA